MGGISLGYNPPFNLNISNPASYSSLSLTTFETAVSFNQFQLKTAAKTENINNSSLSYFAFGFPVKSKKWGTCFGLLPYSNVGYSISDAKTNADGDEELHTYHGSGGLNQFFVGNGFSPFKNLSIGANASYLFGVINQERTIEYPHLAHYFNTRVTEATSVGAVFFNFGMQLTFDSLRIAPSDSIKMLDKKLATIHDSLEVVRDTMNKATAEQKNEWENTIAKLNAEYIKTDSLKKHVLHRKDKSDWSLTFGLVASPQTSLSATKSNLTESFVNSQSLGTVVRDTIANISGEKGKLVLPFSAGFGMMLKKGNKWLIGADFSMQNWKDYTILGASDSLANSWRISAGAQFTPNERAMKSYWKTIQYRLGFHYGQTYLQLRNSQLIEYGISAGLGLPIKRSAAVLHLSAEGGRRGTTSNNLIEENYLKFSIGFTLNDLWFIKPKFD